MRRRKRNYSDAGSLAKYLRLYYGYSRRKLAEACGLSQVQILAYEHGSRGMSIGNIIKLAGFFDVDPNDLIYDEFENAVASLPSKPHRNQEVRKRFVVVLIFTGFQCLPIFFRPVSPYPPYIGPGPSV